MQAPRISAIAAIGENRELGYEGGLIWRLPGDLKRLKALTTGHPIIMGRKTYESIGRPLPGRTNIVISRSTDYDAPGCIVTTSLDAALAAARKTGTDEIFIFGGASLYEEALPMTGRLYLTAIHDSAPEADCFFPSYDAFSRIISAEEHNEGGTSYTYCVLERA